MTKCNSPEQSFLNGYVGELRGFRDASANFELEGSRRDAIAIHQSITSSKWLRWGVAVRNNSLSKAASKQPRKRFVEKLHDAAAL